MKTNKIEYSTESYELQSYLTKAYPKLTKEVLDTLVDIMIKFPSDSENFKLITHVLTQELNY